MALPEATEPREEFAVTDDLIARLRGVARRMRERASLYGDDEIVDKAAARIAQLEDALREALQWVEEAELTHGRTYSAGNAARAALAQAPQAERPGETSDHWEEPAHIKPAYYVQRPDGSFSEAKPSAVSTDILLQFAGYLTTAIPELRHYDTASMIDCVNDFLDGSE
jgi:hypothetical protein